MKDPTAPADRFLARLRGLDRRLDAVARLAARGRPPMPTTRPSAVDVGAGEGWGPLASAGVTRRQWSDGLVWRYADGTEAP